MLAGLLQGDRQLMSEYMCFLRESYVERVFKHCKRFGVDRDALDDLFGQLWQRKDELPTVAPSRWGDELCTELSASQKPDQVLRQFVQAGVLRYRNQESNRLEWAVPYQP